SVKLRGHPGRRRAVGLPSRGPADRAASRRAAVRRGDRAARRRRLSAHHRLAYSPPGGRVSGVGRSEDSMTDANVDARLAALESRLGRLEELMAGGDDKLARGGPRTEGARPGSQAWGTRSVSP